VVFVYGTLMSGLDNHATLAGLGARFLCAASIGGRLYICDDPALVLCDDGPRVLGEVYELPDEARALRVLDAFEDEGIVYARRRCDVLTAAGSLCAFVYVTLMPIELCTLVEGGDYRAFLARS
jgi:gamma-glutamylcyclotransferase (GGCT)/AIG2-like uncharacterized protein YtfP